MRSPVGLNDVSSATIVSEQRCEAEALRRLPSARSGITAAVLSCVVRRVPCLNVKTVEDKLTAALEKAENVFKDRVQLN